MWADAGHVMLRRGDVLRVESTYGGSLREMLGREFQTAASGANLRARDRGTPYFGDDFIAAARDDVSARLGRESGVRSFVTVALLNRGEWIGSVALFRYEMNPFDPKVGPILQSFADQAVIAIENARVLKELERSNRDARAALHQQTAVADVLRLISAHPGDLQTVLDGIVSSAARAVRRRISGGDAAPRRRTRDGRRVRRATAGTRRTCAAYPCRHHEPASDRAASADLPRRLPRGGTRAVGRRTCPPGSIASGASVPLVHDNEWIGDLSCSATRYGRSTRSSPPSWQPSPTRQRSRS